MLTTEDLNDVWVECDGHCKWRVPVYPQGYCENHYIHSFELENGLFFFSSKSRHTMCREVSWARRCV
ncbi:hypothetical protein CAZ07_02310 [Pseudomonas aeruginosa]|nr:hypothetical protein CAZ07_02310 [Pseudomonas aeruginosa]